MARAIQLEKPSIIEELPEAEEEIETEVAAVSADIEDLYLKPGAYVIDAGTDLGTMPSGVQFDIDGREKEPEKTFLPLPQGKRIIILD